MAQKFNRSQPNAKNRPPRHIVNRQIKLWAYGRFPWPKIQSLINQLTKPIITIRQCARLRPRSRVINEPMHICTFFYANKSTLRLRTWLTGNNTTLRLCGQQSGRINNWQQTHQQPAIFSHKGNMTQYWRLCTLHSFYLPRSVWKLFYAAHNRPRFWPYMKKITLYRST